MKPNFSAIKAHYAKHAAAIEATPSTQWAIDPYAWEHEARMRMTPIERGVWSDIRSNGMVFYPQYPVGRFFVDFANPRAKVAIECDGAAYHQDKAKDAKRQDEIEAMGWTVYRLTGKECMANTEQVEDENGALRWVVSASEKLLRGIDSARLGASA